MIGARTALAHEPGDPALIVGVVDSGVNPAHAEFGRRLRSGFDTVQLGHGEMAGGVALLGDNSGADVDPSDRFVGHGTACAAIIGATGERIPPGLAGDCQVLPIRSLGAALFPGRQQAVGVGAVSDLDIGLVMAVQLGARSST
jgi:subtilisin family serine protease